MIVLNCIGKVLKFIMMMFSVFLWSVMLFMFAELLRVFHDSSKHGHLLFTDKIPDWFNLGNVFWSSSGIETAYLWLLSLNASALCHLIFCKM